MKGTPEMTCQIASYVLCIAVLILFFRYVARARLVTASHIDRPDDWIVTLKNSEIHEKLLRKLVEQEIQKHESERRYKRIDLCNAFSDAVTAIFDKSPEEVSLDDLKQMRADVRDIQKKLSDEREPILFPAEAHDFVAITALVDRLYALLHEIYGTKGKKQKTVLMNKFRDLKESLYAFELPCRWGKYGDAHQTRVALEDSEREMENLRAHFRGYDFSQDSYYYGISCNETGDNEGNDDMPCVFQVEDGNSPAARMIEEMFRKPPQEASHNISAVPMPA